MAPAYKLTYFNGRGAAEPIRYIFKYGNIEFEDVRIESENWPQMKEKFLFGQLPVLEYNGKVVNQSTSICRYVAKLANLSGSDDWENLEIDAIVDSINDIKTKMSAMRTEQDESKKKIILNNIISETIPYYSSRFDSIVLKNNGYLAVGRLTWADLYFVAVAPNIERFCQRDIYTNYPNLKGLIDKVQDLPAIKKWIEERPKTEF